MQLPALARARVGIGCDSLDSLLTPFQGQRMNIDTVRQFECTMVCTSIDTEISLADQIVRSVQQHGSCLTSGGRP